MADDVLRILIVDDTITYRKIAESLLSTIPGVQIVGSAANGKIALDKMSQSPVDLLLLDLEMPELDGLGVLRRLKEQGTDVGVIMLSAFTTTGASATLEALELGAFDFIVKPSGASMQENQAHLLLELRHKIAAYSRTRGIREILRSGGDRKPSSAMGPVVSGFNPMERHATQASRGKIEIAAIGISTGGPPALTEMLPLLPKTLEIPVLIVQHMPPVFTKSLADDLNRRCATPVKEAENGDALQPGHVYIAQGGRHMKLRRDEDAVRVVITEDPPENSCRPSVDYLFRSVAEIYGPNALAVIMTGMGNDGSAGCRLMKSVGATIIAQNAASCVVYGMPREPIEQGVVDVVVPLSDIAGEIVRQIRKGATA